MKFTYEEIKRSLGNNGSEKWLEEHIKELFKNHQVVVLCELAEEHRAIVVKKNGNVSNTALG